MSPNLLTKGSIIGTIRPKNHEILEQFRAILKPFDIEVMQGNLATLAGKTNLFVSIGGDGSYISLCREISTLKEASMFGIHTGHLGFLTDVNPQDLQAFCGELMRGGYKKERLFLLSVKIGTMELPAVNDVVILRKNSHSTATIYAYFEGRHFNTYKGDGLIASSALGSTAYNLSAGGAILHAGVEAFCLTPICSHSLTQRPLIVPSNSNLTLKSGDDVSVVIDGQQSFNLSDFGEIQISVSSNFGVNLIRRKNRDYFEVLKEKLKWGE